jgi:hypothetical protein
MDSQIFFTLLVLVFAYICIMDQNVLSWISIKIEHCLVYLQLRWIKLLWRFKKF